MDWSEARYGHDIYWPMLAIFIKNRTKNMTPDEINRHAGMLNDRYNLIDRCQSNQIQPWNRYNNLRRAFRELFPVKIWVPNHQKDMLRFLSYHTCEYPFDNVDQEGAENNRKRKLVCSASLTNLAESAPPEVNTMATNTEPQPSTSAMSVDSPSTFTMPINSTNASTDHPTPSENPPIQRAPSPY